MGVVSGAMTVARFRVVGELPEGWRDHYRERLNEFAFREPVGKAGGGREEVEGWVQVHNLLDNEFDDFNRWLYNDVILFALRVDKKRLPAKLFRATLEKKCAKWCAEKEVQRCPASVRQQLKDDLEDEWYARTLPSVSVTEAAWHVNHGWLLVHSLSESVAERYRKRFHRTFGAKLVPWSPLDFLDDRTMVEGLLTGVPTPMQLGVHLAAGSTGGGR
jgi:recombination associated protein RdgC